MIETKLQWGVSQYVITVETESYFHLSLIPFGHKCRAQNKCIQMETRCLDETTG